MKPSEIAFTITTIITLSIFFIFSNTIWGDSQGVLRALDSMLSILAASGTGYSAYVIAESIADRKKKEAV